VGGGLAFDVGARTVGVSVRYDVGFVKFVTFSDSKNPVLSFIGTLGHRLARSLPVARPVADGTSRGVSHRVCAAADGVGSCNQR